MFLRSLKVLSHSVMMLQRTKDIFQHLRGWNSADLQYCRSESIWPDVTPGTSSESLFQVTPSILTVAFSMCRIFWHRLFFNKSLSSSVFDVESKSEDRFSKFAPVQELFALKLIKIGFEVLFSISAGKCRREAFFSSFWRASKVLPNKKIFFSI